MGRLLVHNFLKEAQRLTIDEAAKQAQQILTIYEDSVHTTEERISILESDVLDLLIAYKNKEDARFNISMVVGVLISSTADLGIYLSDTFLNQYGNTNFFDTTLSDYVQQIYKMRKRKASQQANNSRCNVDAGFDDKNKPEPKLKVRKGRPKKTFKDMMRNDDDGSKLRKIHETMKGKKGKDAALIIWACIEKGWLEKPTFKQVESEFGDIGVQQGFTRYLNNHETLFTDNEKKGAINSLD